MTNKFEGPEVPKNPQEKETSAKEKSITLPNQKEMLERLISVSSESHLQERFYPLLLKHAGSQKVAQGIIMMFGMAIHEYTKDLGKRDLVANLLYKQMPLFIDALVSDPEVAKEAKDSLEEILSDIENK